MTTPTHLRLRQTFGRRLPHGYPTRVELPGDDCAWWLTYGIVAVTYVGCFAVMFAFVFM